MLEDKGEYKIIEIKPSEEEFFKNYQARIFQKYFSQKTSKDITKKEIKFISSELKKLGKKLQEDLIIKESKPENIESKLKFKTEEDKLKYEIYEFFLNAAINGLSIIEKDKLKDKLNRLHLLSK